MQQQRIELPTCKAAQVQDFRIAGLAADGGSLAISTTCTGLVNSATRQYGVVSIFKRAHGGQYGKATLYEWPDADVGAMALDNGTLVVSENFASINAAAIREPDAVLIGVVPSPPPRSVP